MMSLTAKGIDSAIKKVKNADLSKIVYEMTEEARVKAENYAKELCPVVTGNLRNSIFSYTAPGCWQFILGASAKHAVFNEYGSITTPIGTVQAPLHAKITGFRPFLRPAIYKVKEEMPKIFKKSCEEIIEHG